MNRRHKGISACGIALCAVTGPVSAQTAPSQVGAAREHETSGSPTEVADIIVTAQKRSERLQDVPISITALDRSELVSRNINTLQDLPRAVPTLKGGFAPGISSVRIGIRGLGSAGNSAIEPSVATFVDGVYIPRAGSLYSTLVDLAGIEVLSGPQGTLFGRNASVGAINIRTQLPSDSLSGSVAGEIGTSKRYRGEGILNVPLSETTSARVSALAQTMDGFWRGPGRVRSGLDNFGGRGTLRSELSSNLTLTIRGDYTLTEGGGWNKTILLPDTLTPATEAAFRQRLGGLLPDTDRSNRDTNLYTDEWGVHSTHWGVSSNLALGFGDGFSLSLTDSFRRWEDRESDGDIVATSIPILGRSIRWLSKSHSHELQMNSPPEGLLGGRLRFVGGLFYFEEKLVQDYRFNLLANFCGIIAPPAAQLTCGAGQQRNAASYRLDQDTKSIAGYLQSSFKLIDQVELTLGARYTRDEKNGNFDGSVRNPAAAALQTNEVTGLKYAKGRFTYRANLAWHPSENMMLFATYSTGFKSGGFNSGNSNTALGQTRIFQAETVRNYEGGLRYQTVGREVTFNATVFRMDVQNFQERAQNGTVSVIRNVGSLRQQGIETEIIARPVANFRVNASFAFLNSKFLSYPNAPGIPGLSASQDLSGSPLTYSPKISGTVGAEYSVPIDRGYRLTLRSDIFTTSKYYAGNQIDANPRGIQSAFETLSARATLFAPGNRWSVAIFADNITDVRSCGSIGNQVLDAAFGVRNPATGTALRCFLDTPRTLGARAEFKF